jgi:hypothetical protein
VKGGISILSEADLIAKRAALRWLARQHSEWTHHDLADALSMSCSWVSKWLQRLRQADPADVMALHSRSRAMSCCRKSAFSATSSVLLLSKSASVPSGKEEVNGLVH